MDGEKCVSSLDQNTPKNSGLQQRYSELMNRQDWYIQGIERATSFELSNLDQKASDLPLTARHMIMKMTTTDDNQMFTSVDLSWDKGVVFTFLKVYEQEAKIRIADEGSYLHFHFGD